MSLRPFVPDEFDVFWRAVSSRDPTVAVGAWIRTGSANASRRPDG